MSTITRNPWYAKLENAERIEHDLAMGRYWATRKRILALLELIRYDRDDTVLRDEVRKSCKARRIYWQQVLIWRPLRWR